MGINKNTALLEFFKWWLQEAESDSPAYCVTAYGLCCNSHNFGVRTEVSAVISSLYIDVDCPFGGCEVYEWESAWGRMHLNHERIAFVKSQIERLEKLNETI